MTTVDIQSGTEIATAMPLASLKGQLVPIAPVTVTELLGLLEGSDVKGIPMLKTASGVLATYVSVPIDQLTIQAVFEGKDLFRSYLIGRKYAENSVRTYVNHAKMLINLATKLGWVPIDTVPPAWVEVLARSKKQAIKKNLVKFLANARPAPALVTEEDANRWTEGMVQKGFSIAHTRRTVNWLRRTLRELGVSAPGINTDRGGRYQVPVNQFPSRLKSEVQELLKWKQAEFAPGRPSEGQHRAVTARALKDVICRLFGYAVFVRKDVGIKCLADLVREDIVGGFVGWRINERRNGGYGVRISLGMLRAALRYHPVHRQINMDWCEALINSIALEPESSQRARKAKKFVAYAVLEAVPALIRKARSAVTTDSMKVSELVMHELLMFWLLILPWRQKNIRQMRVSGPEPNIFKEPISPFSELKKPDWVLQEENANPTAKFWQFRFSPHETKNGHEVHALLPKQLVPLLEHYLCDHRPRLLRGNYCDTLFLNRRGGALDTITTSQIVRELTLRYAGREVTPHRFRDIIAYAWLDAHPESYLLLSKLLWHRNVSTTIRIYGARFNESNAVCAMEAWVDERHTGGPSK